MYMFSTFMILYSTFSTVFIPLRAAPSCHFLTQLRATPSGDLSWRGSPAVPFLLFQFIRRGKRSLTAWILSGCRMNGWLPFVDGRLLLVWDWQFDILRSSLLRLPRGVDGRQGLRVVTAADTQCVGVCASQITVRCAGRTRSSVSQFGV
jgi:hypothetical protein